MYVPNKITVICIHTVKIRAQFNPLSPKLIGQSTKQSAYIEKTGNSNLKFKPMETRKYILFPNMDGIFIKSILQHCKEILNKCQKVCISQITMLVNKKSITHLPSQNRYIFKAPLLNNLWDSKKQLKI